MNRNVLAGYAIFSYLVGLAGLMYFFAFVGGWQFLPVQVHDTLFQSVHPATALFIDTFIIFVFGLQHSVMARAWFKKLWILQIPPASERSTYVLISGIFMFIICFAWQPLPGIIWDIQPQWLRNVFITVQLLGWSLTVLSSFLINHFELFGLQQVYYHYVEKTLPRPQFTDRFFYRLVRHPLQLGLLIGLWSAPTMSVTLLVLSSLMSIYIFVGLYFEERDLVRVLGEEYEKYRKRVPKLLPTRKAA